MYYHPLPEGMKMDAYLLPECCFSNCSPFLISFHTPPKSYGTREKITKTFVTLCENGSWKWKNWGLWSAAVVLWGVFYNVQNCTEKLLTETNYSSSSSSPSAKEVFPLLTHVSSGMNLQKTGFLQFLPLDSKLWGFFWVDYFGKGVEPFKCFSNWPNASLLLLCSTFFSF